MAEKKNIQKNDRKESGAGLAAGKCVENKTQHKDTDAHSDAEERQNQAIIAHAFMNAAKEIEESAGESVTVEIDLEENGATFYVFGSELACLRLAYNARNARKRPAVGFYKPLRQWYLSLIHI